MDSGADVQASIRKKLGALNLECEQYRVQMGSLEGRLALADTVMVSLREVLDGCGAYSMSQDVPNGHRGPSRGHELILELEEPEEADFSPEQRRKALLALGAKVVVDHRDVTVHLDLPLVQSTPPVVGSAEAAP